MSAVHILAILNAGYILRSVLTVNAILKQRYAYPGKLEICLRLPNSGKQG